MCITMRSFARKHCWGDPVFVNSLHVCINNNNKTNYYSKSFDRETYNLPKHYVNTSANKKAFLRIFIQGIIVKHKI